MFKKAKKMESLNDGPFQLPVDGVLERNGK